MPKTESEAQTLSFLQVPPTHAHAERSRHMELFISCSQLLFQKMIKICAALFGESWQCVKKLKIVPVLYIPVLRNRW